LFGAKTLRLTPLEELHPERSLPDHFVMPDMDEGKVKSRDKPITLLTFLQREAPHRLSPDDLKKLNNPLSELMKQRRRALADTNTTGRDGDNAADDRTSKRAAPSSGAASSSAAAGPSSPTMPAQQRQRSGNWQSWNSTWDGSWDGSSKWNESKWTRKKPQ